jgi:flagellar M-ring protein FliF
MEALAQAKRVLANLIALGPRRLAALAIIGVSVFALVGFAGYYLSRPTMEILYSGLDREDVIGIGSALREAGIPFDVSSDGATVLVAVGQTSQARMTLAEKGLPHSGSVGNELYDKLGSLGLTSFMQEVTRVRAIEGELARTIQMMRGVKAARVHIVLGDEGSFRRERQPPSASVIIRTDGADDRVTGVAIRHLVAAAVPNMKTEQVTVLNVDGQLLATGGDTLDEAPENLLGLEKSVASYVRANIDMTLAPYLSAKNFEVSVAARLNADKVQTNETTYNPDQKAERSVRTVKEKSASQNSTGGQPAGVQTNLPKPPTSSSDTKQSTDNNDKKEELTNYEISSRQVSTTSAGYVIKNLSVAVLINRSALMASLGDKATPEALDKQVKEIEQLVMSAGGLQKDRGDEVKLSIVDFVDSGKDMEPVAGPSYLEILERQTGTIISAAAILLVAGLLIWFGVRPVTRALLAEPAGSAGALEASGVEAADALGGGFPTMAAMPEMPEAPALFRAEEAPDEYFEALMERREKGPQRQLQKLVDFDEEHAAAILRQWIREGANA